MNRKVAAVVGLCGALVLSAVLGIRSSCEPQRLEGCSLQGIRSGLAGVWSSRWGPSLDSIEFESFQSPNQYPWTVAGMALITCLVLLHRRRSGSLSQRPDERGLEADLTDVDPKTRRQDRRRAKLLARGGDFEEAAEVCFRIGEYDEAADFFARADRMVRAAEVRQHQSLFLEAAGIFSRAGEHERAAGLFAQEQQWDRAADSYQRLGRISVAAEMHEKSGNLECAAALYEKAEFHAEAARLWGEAKQWERAADSLVRVLADEGGDTRGGAANQQTKHGVALKAAALYRLAGRPERAGPVLEQVGCWREAAELAASVEDYAAAARAFQRAGDSVRSAEALERGGDEQAAARMLGEYHREHNNFEQAANCLERAGEYGEAGDLYRQQGAFARAAACYARQQDWAEAAEMLELDGDIAAAADCHERSGALEAAARCFAQLGRVDREAGCLLGAGLYLRAAQVYRAAGKEEEAVAALQKISTDDETLLEGTALLGELFCHRGHPEYAIRVLEAAMDEGPPGRERLQAYSVLARAFQQVGQWDHCAQTLEKILSLDIDFEDAEQRLRQAREELEKQAQCSSPAALGRVGPKQSAGRYEVRGELGRGGMGIVHEAFDTVLDRRVAFKVLPGGLKSNAGACSHFLREAKAAAKLNHPHIVTVYDAGEQDGHYYIAMELVDGVTFKQVLSRRGALATRSAMYVALQLCDALSYAHAQRVVHRDIKPANVMWTRNKQTKIMDFGLAKLMEEVRCQTSVAAGTPYYMSPEQTLGKNVDHRTDIYALGVTLFEMITGTVPFKQGDVSYHHMHTPAPDVRELAPGVDQPVAELIGRCLAKDPTARFDTARQMAEQIRRVLGPVSS